MPTARCSWSTISRKRPFLRWNRPPRACALITRGNWRSRGVTPTRTARAWSPWTAWSDIRNVDNPDERGRVPTAEDSAAAILRAQAALHEIEQRRQLEQRRTEEEDRSRQLARWAEADTRTFADVEADAAALAT